MRKTKFHILAILLATMLMLTAFAAPALAGDTAFGTGMRMSPSPSPTPPGTVLSGPW